MSEPENNSGRTSQRDDDDPPPLSIKLPKRSNLPRKSKNWNYVQLPVDILLLTVEDCEFLACYHYLRNSFKSYHQSLGYVYFGNMGDDEEPFNVALIQGPSGPGGSQTAVRNAVTQLRPKATFSVGFCSGLNHEKTKLGDVVVSYMLTMDAYKTPVSRDMANFVRHAADGWKVPLESPEVREVNVHRDGVILGSPDLVSAERQCKLYSEAIAVEMEGKGIFAAAHDMKLEWVVVKGVSDYAVNSRSSTRESWKIFACVMAASVVSNMLSDPVVFEQWPRYEEQESSTITSKRDLPFPGSQDAKRRKSDFAAEMGQPPVRKEYPSLPQLVAVKHGMPDKDELEGIAIKLTSVWETLGRRLGVEQERLEAFNNENYKYFNKAYNMLSHWKQRHGSAATYQVLYDALCHSYVNRKDLAEEYCCDR